MDGHRYIDPALNFSYCNECSGVFITAVENICFELQIIVVCCMLQSIPSDMEFDPNSNPPCYKTKEEVLH